MSYCIFYAELNFAIHFKLSFKIPIYRQNIFEIPGTSKESITNYYALLITKITSHELL